MRVFLCLPRQVTTTAVERAWRDGLGVLIPQGHNTQDQVSSCQAASTVIFSHVVCFQQTQALRPSQFWLPCLIYAEIGIAIM